MLTVARATHGPVRQQSGFELRCLGMCSYRTCRAFRAEAVQGTPALRGYSLFLLVAMQPAVDLTGRGDPCATCDGYLSAVPFPGSREEARENARKLRFTRVAVESEHRFAKDTSPDKDLQEAVAWMAERTPQQVRA